jgi:hypothetical protein
MRKISRMAITRIVVTMSADTPIYVVLEQDAEDRPRLREGKRSQSRVANHECRETSAAVEAEARMESDEFGPTVRQIDEAQRNFGDCGIATIPQLTSALPVSGAARTGRDSLGAGCHGLFLF